jgi:hypothetical protein
MEKMPAFEMIKKSLTEKGSMKQDVYANTFKHFGILKKELESSIDQLTEEVHNKDSRLKFAYENRGEFEVQVNLGSDILFFQMHTNVFLFDQANPLWKTSYLKEDANRGYCGVINVFNFLADSIKYNRMGDVGYLIARIFINKDNHFMVQGKRQLGFLYNDFMNAELTPALIKDIIHSTYLYTIEFDLLATPYDQIKEISVMELKELSENSQIKTGKRLGFKFQADSDDFE